MSASRVPTQALLYPSCPSPSLEPSTDRVHRAEGCTLVRRLMQEKELAHARLGMIAAAGFLAQEAVTKQTWSSVYA